MIELTKKWDLSATIVQTDPNSVKFQTKITGRFDPAVATPEKIFSLTYALKGLTRNTYVDTLLTAQRNLNDLE